MILSDGRIDEIKLVRSMWGFGKSIKMGVKSSKLIKMGLSRYKKRVKVEDLRKLYNYSEGISR
jgi:hypothetical protein